MRTMMNLLPETLYVSRRWPCLNDRSLQYVFPFRVMMVRICWKYQPEMLASTAVSFSRRYSNLMSYSPACYHLNNPNGTQSQSWTTSGLPFWKVRSLRFTSLIRELSLRSDSPQPSRNVSLCLLTILEALRSRYRVSRHHFTLFYKERIQETLAGCLYNEGQRKLKKPTDQQQAEPVQQWTTRSEHVNISSLTL